MSSTWELDPVHSSVGFTVRHMMVSNVHGRFRTVDVDVDFDPERPEAGRVEATIQAASIDTGMEPRDAHLRSADFFDAERYPTLRFVSTSVERRGEDRFLVHGDLTIRDVTRPVTLDVEFLGAVPAMDGGRKAGFAASTRISRKEWGLTWNVGLETGGWLVGDDVRIEIDVELTEPAAATEPTGEAVAVSAS